VQWSWREGKKVRTKSRSLGPVGGDLRMVGAVIESYRASPYEIDEETAYKEMKERWTRTERERQAHLSKLHAAFGLRLPGTASMPLREVTCMVAKGSPSAAEGRGQVPQNPILQANT
jgi:hypothetical protein